MLLQDVCLSICLSVRPSVTCRHSIATAEYYQTFSPSGDHTIIEFPYQMLWQYSNGDLPLNMGVECRVYEKIAIFGQYFVLFRK